VFIFVTTEQRKVLETILSRCFTVPFKRIGLEQTVSHLEVIAKTELIKLTPAISESIARRSEGRLRDAVTMLEQLWVLSDGKEIDQDTLALVGLCGQDVYSKFTDNIYRGELKEGLELFRHWLASMGPTEFLKGFEDYLHKLFLQHNGFKVSVIQPESKITWVQLNECIGRLWEMQDVTRSHYSQPRLEAMLCRLFLSEGARTDSTAKYPPPPLITDVHPLSVSNGTNGHANGTNGVSVVNGKVPVKGIADLNKFLQG
jgi:DNA polymerase III gamma/tau subunit